MREAIEPLVARYDGGAAEEGFDGGLERRLGQRVEQQPGVLPDRRHRQWQPLTLHQYSETSPVLLQWGWWSHFSCYYSTEPPKPDSFAVSPLRASSSLDTTEFLRRAFHSTPLEACQSFIRIPCPPTQLPLALTLKCNVPSNKSAAVFPSSGKYTSGSFDGSVGFQSMLFYEPTRTTREGSWTRPTAACNGTEKNTKAKRLCSNRRCCKFALNAWTAFEW